MTLPAASRHSSNDYELHVVGAQRAVPPAQVESDEN
jgi:hypothetical protein